MLTAAQAPDPDFTELAELLADLDVTAIAEGLGVAEHGEPLEDLRVEALDELTSAAKHYAGRAVATLPTAALEGNVTIDRPVRAIASLAMALCRLLDQPPSVRS